MKASEAKLLDFLKKAPQLVIPIYQRTYSWTDKQCRQLWDDVIRAGNSESISVHFIGSIVYVEEGLSQVSHQAPLLVIDGQQRLTSVTLLLEALARALGDTEPIEGFSAAKLRHYYLTNALESGDRFFKLLLSQTDDASLRAIVKSQPSPHAPSLRVEQNFSLFQELVESCQDDLTPVCRGLAKLILVDIALSRGHDNPQLIFESMNSTGKELSQADLIRNFILMGLEPVLQTNLYQNYWRPMELGFGQQAYSEEFDSFMRHYLTVRTGEIPREREVYEAFKEYSLTPAVRDSGIEALVKDIRTLAGHFCAIALGKETDKELAAAFHDLREFKADVVYPFLLELYADYADGVLKVEDFLEAVRLVEAYVFRRAICAIPTNSMNKTFGTFGKALQKDRYLESIKAHFLLLPSYRRFPTDEEFHRDLQTRDLYNFPRRLYWLRRLENHGRKERVAVDEYTIEHILPQNPNLSPAWRKALGDDWQRVQQQWLHTLGNLTLTGYNSEYSDRPFPEKRDMKGGFKESPLRLNAVLGKVDEWNEQAIKARAAALADTARDVWVAPALPPDVLDGYRTEPRSKASKYDLDYYPHLKPDDKRALFEAFRREVMALDDCVSMEFQRWFIAFKAEQDFAIVVPRPKRLRIGFYVPVEDLNDPSAIAIDRRGKDRHADCITEAFIETEADVHAVMGLVRQAFERQMTEGGDS
jgi:uncharacterized protein with ParB-like and HNH nuclease domain/predicted transport protein